MENITTPKTNLLTLLVLAVLAGVFMYLATTRVDQALKNKAVDDCGRVSTYTRTLDTGEKVSAPAVDVYKACLKDKGYLE